MRKLLLTMALAMATSLAMSQDAAPEENQEAAQAAAKAEEPKFLFMPDLEISDSELKWSDLEKGKFYAISAPAVWKKATDEADSAGYFMEEHPAIVEYISINKEEDLLTWIDVKAAMAEEVSDTIVARVIVTDTKESVHTADINDQYLDIIGTLSGHRQKSRNFQLAKYAGKDVIYDYNNKILRFLELDPKDKKNIIGEN